MIHRINNERGAISLITATLIGMLMTLVVTSIASSMISELRQSNDSEQSMRAFYAAESGVEDAMSKIRKAQKDGVDLPEKDICTGTADTDAGNLKLLAGEVSDGTPLWQPTVGWTCQTIRLSGKTSGKMLKDQAVQLDLDGTSPSLAPRRFMLEWSTADMSSCTDAQLGAEISASNAQRLPASAYPASCPPPVEMTVVKYPRTTQFGQGQIETINLLGLPGIGGSGDGSGVHGGGTVSDTAPLQARCYRAATYKCKLMVNGLGGGSNYIIRLRSRYQDSDYRMTFYKNAADSENVGDVVLTPVGMATIDVVGKAGSAYRRVVYKMPLSTGTAVGLDYAIYSGSDLCKDLSTVGGNPTSNGCAPAPPTGDGVANIGIGGCVFATEAECSAGVYDADLGYLYDYEGINDTDTSWFEANIKSCEFDWGDGVTTGEIPGSDPRCRKNGNFGIHEYSYAFTYGSDSYVTKPFPGECKNILGSGNPPHRYVKATLTINLYVGDATGNTRTSSADFALPRCYQNPTKK